MSITIGGKKKTEFKKLFGMPDTHSMAGMPDTRRLNGGWGDDHPGRIGNGTKSPLQKKREGFLQDPQERRRQGQMRLDETDNAPGFLKDKLMRNGSVTATGYGMCLKGEEEGAIPEDGLFYGIKNGKRGWYKVSEIVGATDDGKDIADIETSIMEVVVDVVWDPESHQLLKHTKKVKIVADEELESVEPVESLIFQAAPLQDELL